jgi:hypothetical protein
LAMFLWLVFEFGNPEGFVWICFNCEGGLA